MKIFKLKTVIFINVIICLLLTVSCGSNTRNSEVNSSMPSQESSKNSTPTSSLSEIFSSDGTFQNSSSEAFPTNVSSSSATSTTLQQDKNISVWATDSMDRVERSRPIQRNKIAKIYAAKGEAESFQIVVNTVLDNAVINDIVVSDLVNSKGNVIESKGNIEIFREQYIKLVGKSGVKYQPGQIQEEKEVPDALIPLYNYKTGQRLKDNIIDPLPCEIISGQCQPFWVDVYVPSSAPAGEYKGYYSVLTSNGVAQGEVSLIVWNFSMPQLKSQKNLFMTWTIRNSEITEELARNNIFTESVSKENETQLMQKYGYNSIQIPLFSNQIDMSDIPSNDLLNELKAKHISEIPLYCYSADEITGQTEKYQNLMLWGQALRQAGIKHFITMVPEEKLLDDGTGHPAVDWWCVLGNQYSDNVPIIKKAQEKGCEIWTYTGLVQDNYTPKWQLDYDIINFRMIQGYINYSIDAKGFLYWALDRWNRVDDPWNSVKWSNNNGVTSLQGDGILIYPGSDIGLDIPAMSIRIKAIRDGFDDYEMCKLLEQKVGITEAKDYAATVGGSFRNWTKDKNKLNEVRILIGNAIQANQ